MGDTCSKIVGVPFEIYRGFKIADMPQRYRAVAERIDSSEPVALPDYMKGGDYIGPYYLRCEHDQYLGLNELGKFLELMKNNATFNVIQKFFSGLVKEDEGKLVGVKNYFQKLSDDPRVAVVMAIKRLKKLREKFIFPRDWSQIAEQIKATRDLIRNIDPQLVSCELPSDISDSLRNFHRRAVEEANKIESDLARRLPKPGSTISVRECEYTLSIEPPPDSPEEGPPLIPKDITASEMRRLKPHIYNSLYELLLRFERIIRERYQLTAKAYMESYNWQYLYFRRYRCE